MPGGSCCRLLVVLHLAVESCFGFSTESYQHTICRDMGRVGGRALRHMQRGAPPKLASLFLPSSCRRDGLVAKLFGGGKKKDSSNNKPWLRW